MNIFFDQTIPKHKHLLRNDLFLFIHIFWLELLFRLFVFEKLTWSGLLYNSLFSITFICLFSAILSIIKTRFWDPITIISATLIFVIYGAQHIYNAFFRKLFSWFSLMRAGQVADFLREIILKILLNIPIMLLFALPLLLFSFRRKIGDFLYKQKNNSHSRKNLNNQKKASTYKTATHETYSKATENYHNDYLESKRRISNRRFNRNRYKIALSSLIISCILFILNVGILTFASQKVNSAFDLYFKTSDIYWAADRIGLMPAMRVDLRNLILPKYGPRMGQFLSLKNNSGKATIITDVTVEPTESKMTKKTPSDTKTPGSGQSTDQSGTAGTSGPTESSKEKPQVEIKDQVLPIDFKALIEQTNDPTIKEMHEYFSQVEPSKTNDHTAIFKGYNLIFITAEGYSKYSPHPELTPTLWHMQENGYKFENFYNPLWGVSTSDGEYTGITGLSPKPGVWSMLESANNNMALVPGNMLRRLGYQTTAWHNHSYDYYGRDQSHPNLGYVYKGLGNGLEVEATWPESDLEMMQKTIDEITKSEPFHAYYMTVSGHMEYTFAGNFIAEKNREYVEDQAWDDPAKAYMATQIELDKALEFLLEQLRAKGMADHTLIVLNADHYPYGLEKKDYDQLAGHELDPNFELYENSLLMYVDGMTPETIEKPCFTLDILPTVYNLMGVPFDSRLFMGTDIFSDKAPLIYFGNRSWVTDQGKYDAIHGTYTPYENADVSDLFLDTYIEERQTEVNNKAAYATAILGFDYYNYLFTDEFWKNVNKDYLSDLSSN